MALTELVVERYKRREKRYEIHDGAGLYLRVSPSGVKAWIYRYQFDGRPRRLTIGQWPGIGLAKARELHSLALQNLQNGIDPGLLAIEKKQKRKKVPTVSDLLDEFFEVELSKTPSGKERRRLIEKDIIPVWGNRKAVEISRRDAVLLIDKVRKRAPVGASRLQSVMVRMWNFAAERGVIEFSPMVGLRRPKETPKTRVLSSDEIKKLWAALDLDNTQIDIYRPTKLAIKLILLLGQRPGEISAMRWSEIDESAMVWTIPAERAKNRQENRVPLNHMANKVLEQAKVYSPIDATDFVFRSSLSTRAGIEPGGNGKGNFAPLGKR